MRQRTPEAGDIVWMNFDPQAGREQSGHRPALVLSPASYNQGSSLMIVCPMTSRIKGYAFEVIVSRVPPSVVLADQVKSIDWRARDVQLKGSIAPEILEEVRDILRDLLLQ